MNIHLPDTLQYLRCFELSFFCSFSICDGETAVHSLNEPSVGRAGSVTVFFSPPSTHEHEMHAILQFNFTLQDKWTVYSYKYSRDMLGNTVFANDTDGPQVNYTLGSLILILSTCTSTVNGSLIDFVSNNP